MLLSIIKKYNTSSDEELMLFVIQGKEKAFEELYKRYSKKMLYFFYQRLFQDNQRAQDFLQDLFLKIIEKPQLFDLNKKFTVWIYAMASNMCKNEYRKDAVRGTKVNDFDFNDIQDTMPVLSLPDKFDQKLFNTNLNIELNKLDETQSLTFVLRYKEGFCIRDISEIMGCSEGTVKSRLFYTIKKLSVKLRVFDPHKEMQ